MPEPLVGRDFEELREAVGAAETAYRVRQLYEGIYARQHGRSSINGLRFRYKFLKWKESPLALRLERSLAADASRATPEAPVV
jgi:hypothetical protein